MLHIEYPCGYKLHTDMKLRLEDYMSCPLHGKTCPKYDPKANIQMAMPYPYPYPEQQGRKQK